MMSSERSSASYYLLLLQIYVGGLLCAWGMAAKLSDIARIYRLGVMLILACIQSRPVGPSDASMLSLHFWIDRLLTNQPGCLVEA